MMLLWRYRIAICSFSKFDLILSENVRRLSASILALSTVTSATLSAQESGLLQIYALLTLGSCCLRSQW